MTTSKPKVAAELRKPDDYVKEIARATTQNDGDVGWSVAFNAKSKIIIYCSKNAIGCRKGSRHRGFCRFGIGFLPSMRPSFECAWPSRFGCRICGSAVV